MPLALLFFILPLAEVYMFITVGSHIGALRTVFLCILTAIGGAMLVQYQGLSVLMRVKNQISRGVLPTREIFDGVLIGFAGVLLMVPGFVTDIIGFLLLVPPIRSIVQTYLTRHFNIRADNTAARDNGIIEGTYERVEDPSPPLRAPDNRDTP
jgi:UPF0716 protein FxsA